LQFIGITPLYKRFNAIRTYLDSTKEIQKIAADPYFDLIYMHASVPHGPYIWDVKGQRFMLFDMMSKKGYRGNLVLADRLLGAVRTSMELAGLWDNTVVLVTSDHGLRGNGGKIPFLLKMRGQKTSFEYARPFSPMRVTKDLLLEILKQGLVTPQSVAEWIDQR
jgi:arylsulfatase A-like enzyme